MAELFDWRTIVSRRMVFGVGRLTEYRLVNDRVGTTFYLLRNRAAVVPVECFCWNDWCHGTRLWYRGSEESGEAQLVL